MLMMTSGHSPYSLLVERRLPGGGLAKTSIGTLAITMTVAIISFTEEVTSQRRSGGAPDEKPTESSRFVSRIMVGSASGGPVRRENLGDRPDSQPEVDQAYAGEDERCADQHVVPPARSVVLSTVDVEPVPIDSRMTKNC